MEKFTLSKQTNKQNDTHTPPLLVLMTISWNLDDETKHDFMVVKMGGNENVEIVFTVVSLVSVSYQT